MSVMIYHALHCEDAAVSGESSSGGGGDAPKSRFG